MVGVCPIESDASVISGVEAAHADDDLLTDSRDKEPSSTCTVADAK